MAISFDSVSWLALGDLVIVSSYDVERSKLQRLSLKGADPPQEGSHSVSHDFSRALPPYMSLVFKASMLLHTDGGAVDPSKLNDFHELFVFPSHLILPGKP